MSNKKNPIEMHRKWRGKYSINVKCDVSNAEDLAVAYTPGVAEVCKEISANPEEQWNLTARANQVAVITDGTAILGLGDIGPEAGMPVMEGKCALFKEYAGVDAFPIGLKTKDSEEIIKTIKIIANSFGGINLEDISAPRCFEIENRLKEELDIPVFHDDQHGTAIVVAAALLNGLKLVDKKIEEVKIVINGAGAAGIGIATFLLDLGVKNLVVCDRNGIINDSDDFNIPQRDLAKVINKNNAKGTLKDAMIGADVFIGVSVGNVVSKEMVRSMNEKAIMFPLANPTPEISYEDAKEAGAYIVGTGSSKYPNQINNVLVFPGLFRGALDARSKTVNKEMMLAAARGIGETISEKELSREYILPYAWNKKAHESVAKFVKEAAIKSGVNKI